MMSTLSLTICTVLMLVAGSYGGLIHASCKVIWTFGTMKCVYVNKAIGDQIEKWKGEEGCKNGGEKCLYFLKSQTQTEIKATHETPGKHYVDDLTFSFTQKDTTCLVVGYSTSELWYAVLDYGTNYCNLNNLITGAGLDKTDGYKESTSGFFCTQYSSRNCDKF